MPVVKEILKFSRSVPGAYSPKKGSSGAAGFDLKSVEDSVIPKRGRKLVGTGLKIQVPQGTYGRVAPRSGLAAKHSIDVGAGVIDQDYRGEVKVVLFNHSEEDFEIKKGDRIAQLICEKIAYPDLQETDELTETDRNEGGFGSTGVRDNN